jgi:hypothetical protein
MTKAKNAGIANIPCRIVTPTESFPITLRMVRRAGYNGVRKIDPRGICRTELSDQKVPARI